MSALLSVSHVDAYYGGIQALRDVSLRIDEGEIVSVLGANGAGKSTLLKCLSREIRTRRGDITFDGRPLPGKSYGVVEAGMVIVPLVSVITKAPDRQAVDQIFSCYDRKVVVKAKDAIEADE